MGTEYCARFLIFDNIGKHPTEQIRSAVSIAPASRILVTDDRGIKTFLRYMIAVDGESVMSRGDLCRNLILPI